MGRGDKEASHHRITQVMSDNSDRKEGQDGVERRASMNHVNPDRLMKVLSEILSDKYDMKITLTVQGRVSDHTEAHDGPNRKEIA